MKKLLTIIFASLLLTGCPSRYDCKCDKTETPTKDVVVKPIVELQTAEYDELEGWKNDNFSEAIPAFAASCLKIETLKTEYIDKSEIKIPTADYTAVCREFFASEIKTGDDFRKFIESNFKPYLVLDNGNADGKFTSYYEAQIHASLNKHGKYQYPVYGKPTNLIEINLQDFDKNLPNRRITGRIEGQKFIPYYTRADIENSEFDAPIIMWADNPIDIHFMQIQGSAVAVMDNGDRIRVGYADNNGHNFRGIGGILLSKGLLESGKVNMMNIKKWLEENPEEGIKNMQENNRFIFHRVIEGDGPIGAYGIALTAGRSMAVDRDIVPLGSILWLNTTTPDRKPLQKLMAAQDIGSAIKGAVRGDYFWGSGGDEVLEQAGNMNQVGQYFILIPKAQK